MTMTTESDRGRAVARIRSWARTIPPEWRAVAEWQIRTGRLDPDYFDERTLPLNALSTKVDGRTVGWALVWSLLREGLPLFPVPDWLAALIAKDATTPHVDPACTPHGEPLECPSKIPDPRTFREREPFGVCEPLDVRKVYVAKEPLPSIEKALEIVHGDREEEYGHPADDLQCIADMWTMFLTRRHTPVTKGSPMEPDEVALMMELLKMARKMRSPGHNDSWVDVPGYVVCRDRIVNRLGTYEERVAKWPVNREAAR